MFVPIGDEPNAKSTPYATYGLIAINLYVWLFICLPKTSLGVDPWDPQVANYVATMARLTGIPKAIILQQASAYDLLTFSYGFRPQSPSLLSLVVSLFLHGGWAHLLGNMLYLWIFGDNVEERLGVVKYLTLYVLSGIAATLFYAIFRSHSPLPLIGASGAISGVLGAYFVWFGHHRVRVLMVIIIFIQVIFVPARWVLVFYLLIENVLPFLVQTSLDSPTAYGAHIGGFFTGAAMALGWDNHRATGVYFDGQAWFARLQSALFEPTIAAEPLRASQKKAEAAHVQDALTRGEPLLAQQLYDALDGHERARIDCSACLAISDLHIKNGNFGHASSILRRYLADHGHGVAIDLARAHLRLGLLQWRGLALTVPARQHFYAVIDLCPESDEASAARQALKTMDG